jgi:nucleoside-diphosphate-sugar epimerase
MKVAITGGSGFLGQRLAAAHLQRGDEVRLLSRSKQDDLGPYGRWFQGDLSADGDFRAFVDGVDVLYHCAGELRDESRMQALHVDGTQRLIVAASGRIGRWVQLSSVGVYGARGAVSVTEETPLHPANHYEKTKADSDRLVLAAAAEQAFPVVILRPSIVFGPGMPNRSLYQLAGMIRRKLFFFIGPPGSSANYIPVDNVIDALIACGEHPSAAGNVYNLSGWTTMEKLIGAMAEALGVPAPMVRIPLFPATILANFAEFIPFSPISKSRVLALSSRTRFSDEKIRSDLSFEHKLSIEEAIRLMFDEVSFEI